jgi:hypothetical protein
MKPVPPEMLQLSKEESARKESACGACGFVVWLTVLAKGNHDQLTPIPIQIEAGSMYCSTLQGIVLRDFYDSFCMDANAFKASKIYFNLV